MYRLRLNMEDYIIPQGEVVLVGHPFVPIGMGEHLRSAFRAFRALGMNIGIRDIYGIASDDSDIKNEVGGYLRQELSPSVNIFCVNADEVEQSLGQIGGLPRNAYNVIYPAWELSKYPNGWAEQLNKFDEVWVTSKFTYESIKPAVSRPVIQMPLAGEINLNTFLGRSYFKIPENSFAFLFFFDFTSYIARKNPWAVLQAFEELYKNCPNEDLLLVIKFKGGETRQKEYEIFSEYIARYKNRVLVIDKLLKDNEIRNLVRCCDCFISLHRSEGFGLGLIAAMFLGKPVVATAYSANLDFMTDKNSCLVRYDLCNVPDGAYPFSEGQVWAEPDTAHAVDHMLKLVSDRDYAREVGERASQDIRVNFSYRATGLRYLHRIKEIALMFKTTLFEEPNNKKDKNGIGNTTPLFVPPGHFYSPIADLDVVKRDEARIFDLERRPLPGIELHEKDQVALLQTLLKYFPEMPFHDLPMDNLRYGFVNPSYSYSDGIFLYSMIRHFTPERIIEIGSGHSSCLILDVNDLFFGGRIKCEFIDPYPELLLSLLKKGEAETITYNRCRLQDVSLDKFEALEENDILFIDSTHVAKVGSDVNYLFFEVLPNLKAGVLIHFHDIFYPFEYPKSWVYEGRNWSEAYILRAFLQYNERFRIILFNTFLEHFHRDFFVQNMPLCLKNPGGSVWLKRMR
jgi:glycosyltransferase involved in cell wall biosynthesis/predicted O-methyltransferase YrrM